MKKLVGVVALLLLVTGMAQASTTLTNQVSSGYHFGTDVYFDVLSPREVWTWSHTGILPTDGVWDTETISSATMEIKYDYVSYGESFTIKADGTTIGTIVGTPVESNSDILIATFNVAPTSLFTSDATLNMSITAATGPNGYSGADARLYYAKLVVVYDVPQPPPPPPQDNTVPAPGAILLSSLGLGLVSWLRGRKSL